MTHATPQLEPYGSIDPLQMAYAGYLGRYHGNTLRNYEYHLNQYFAWCASKGLHPLDDIKRTHVEFYVRDLIAAGYAASTVHTAMAPVKGFYDLAQWDEYIDRDPARRVALPKVDRPKAERLTTRELTLFLEVARDTSPRHHALVSLLCLMGLRISEAASLRVENYDSWRAVNVPTLTFTEKGGKTRVSPVPMPVIRALDTVVDGRTEGPIIPSRNGQQLSRGGATGLVRTVERRAQAAGLRKHVPPHLLRKMGITSAFDMNMPAAKVQEFARHADLKTTMRVYKLDSNSGFAHPVHQVAANLAV